MEANESILEAENNQNVNACVGVTAGGVPGTYRETRCLCDEATASVDAKQMIQATALFYC